MFRENQPFVSIVTPVYNGGKYLEECIRSVLSQTYRNWEYIILNNCSTDNTLEIAEKYSAMDKRIRIHNTDTLLPIMKNWNLALSKISPKSRYCKVVHADDLLFSQCLEKMVSLAESHPTIGMVGSYGLCGERVICKGLPHSTHFLSGKELCRLTLLNRVNCFWSPSSLLIRSDLIRKRQHFYKGMHLHADVEACYETLKESDFGFVHQILTYIRKHEESMTSMLAAPFNRTLVSNLDLLLKYGPLFLSPSEYNGHLRQKAKQYYQFLAHSLFQLRGNNFWHFHLNSIKEIGFQFRYSEFIYATLKSMISKPLKTCTLVFKSALQLSSQFLP
jgi:glycosyltransferase involved in cell wall biosynthesis